MSTLNHSHKQHQNWLAAINLIEQLNDLCFNIRAHRGSSTAQLEGDTFFKPITESTANQISENFVVLDDLSAMFISLNCYEMFHDTVQKWLETKLYWQEQKAAVNFQQHSLLLKQIHVLIWQLIDNSEDKDKSDHDKTRLKNFLLKTHINTIEAVANLRGLSCYYCAKRFLSADEKQALRDEIKSSYLCWSQRIEALHKLPTQFQIFLHIQSDENVLNRSMADFSQLLEDILNNNHKLSNGSEIYNAGSCILSIMNVQLNHGLEQLKNYLPKDLDQWIKQGSATLSPGVEHVSVLAPSL